MSNNCDVMIGQVGPTFGRNGDVKVKPYTDNLEQFQEVKEVCLIGLPGDPRMIEIEKAYDHKGYLIVKFVGVDDISAAESIRGAEVRISEADLLPLAENEFYIDDLIGMNVVTSEGVDLGTLKEVLRSPANDVYVTEKTMIPAVKEIVLSIDLRKKKIVVKPMEGLLQESKNED